MADIVRAYTLTEARNMLNLWKECETALVTGQVKSYRIGTRELTMIDLEEIREAIRYFMAEINALQGNVRSKRVATVVPRDL